MKKLIALLTAAVATLTSAWAATPVAVWEGDFTTEIEGVTLSVPEGSTTTITAEKITIGDKGATIEFSTAFPSFHTTVMMKFKNFAKSGNKALVTIGNAANNNRVGIYANSDGKLCGISSGGASYGSASNLAVMPEEETEHVLVFRYKNTANTDPTNRGTYVFLDGTKAYENSGLVYASNNDYTKRITIGGENNVTTIGSATDLEITALAVFNATLTTDDMAAYKWPSQMGKLSATVVDNALVWDGGSTPTAEEINGAAITITGSGRVDGFEGAPASIKIAEGVEFGIDGVADTTDLVGAGTFFASTKLPSTIPAGVTIAFTGSSDEAAPTEVTTANEGTLKTTGKVALSGSSSGTLEVVSGTTTLMYSDRSKALSGNVTIQQGATMVVTETDSLNYDGTATIKVYGTLDLGATRWSMGANSKLFVYGTGLVTGDGEAGGALDYYTNNNRIVITGNGEISAKIGIRNTGHSLVLAQTRDSTFKISGPIVGAGNIIKGAASNAEGGTGAAGNAFIEFSGENTFTGTFTHEASCGTLRFMPGCTMAASSITVNQGTALTFGSAVAEGEVTINGSVTYANTANEPQIYVNTSIGGAFVSATKRVKLHGKTLSMGEGSSIELTSDSTGTIDGAGTIKWPVDGNPTVTVANTWTGTFSVKALTGSNLQILKWLNANSTLQTTGYTNTNAYLNGGGTITLGTLEILDGGTFTLNNGNTGAVHTFNKVCGNGTFDASVRQGPTDSFVIKTLAGTVQVNCTKPLTINNVVTTLEEQPTSKTKVVALGTGTTISNLTGANATAFTLADGETALEGTISTEGEGEDYGIYVNPVSDITIAIPEVSGMTSVVTVDGETVEIVEGSITAALGATVVVTYTPSEINYVGGGSVTIEAAEGATVVTTEVTAATLREATTIYSNAKDFSSYKLGDVDVSPIEGDVIAIAEGYGVSSNDRWKIELSKAPAGHTIKIVYGGSDPGISAYGVPANMNIDIASGSRLYMQGNQTINGGATIGGEGEFRVGTSTVTISGAVTISATITTGTGSIKLADGATLTCEELPAGKVMTDDTTKVVVYEDGAYQLVDKPTVTVTETTIEGLTSAYIYTAGELVEYFSDWEANFEVTFGADVAAGDVELKGAYGEYEMQTFPMPDTIAANTAWTLLPSSGAGSVTYAEVVGIGTFTCGVNNIKAAVGTTMKVELVIKNGEEKIVLNTQNYALEEAPAPTYPEEIESSDEDVKSAFDAWVKEHNVTDPANANVNAFIVGLAPDATETAIQQAVEDEVPSIDMAELVAGDLEAAVAEIQAKYPNATVTLKNVTTDVAGEGATNTHLYTLVIELKK